MGKNVFLSIMIGIVFSFFIVTHHSFGAEKKYVEGELLIQFKIGTPHSKAKNIVEAQGAQVAKHIPQIRVMRIKAPPKAIEGLKKVLEKNPNVAFVEPNYIAKPEYIPNDTYFSSQWHLAKIKAPEGWDISMGSEDVVIAIADTGVNTNHPDLASKLVPGYNCYAENTDVTDTHGHGTAVAGVAGAVCNNAQGVAGVACKNLIMPLKIANPDGYATYGDMAQAIVYAADHGAKVVNISFAGTGFSYTLQSAIDYAWGKGVVIVAAAGNSNSSKPMYPAALKNVIAVAGTAKDDTKASFSSYGDWVDVSAPAVSIYTTSKSGGYGSSSGTSFASPIVTGLVGLIFSANPSLTNAHVVDILFNTADDLGTPGKDQYFGYGRVNVHKALSMATAGLPKPDTEKPKVSITSPADGSTVSGQVAVTVSAEDNIGVSKVELYIAGNLYASSSSPPYSFTWNTESFSDGAYEIKARAYDAAGNMAESNPVYVTIKNSKDTTPPVVRILKPADGAMISGPFVIKAQATDNVKVKRIEIYVDDKFVALQNFPSISWAYDGTNLSIGPHAVEARAYDEAGNIGRASVYIYKY